MGVNVLAFGAIGQGQSFVGLVAAGDARDDVQSAGLQVFQLSAGNDLLIDDLLDGGLHAFVVALEVGVQLQNSRLVGAVIGGDHVGAGVGIGGIGVQAGFHNVVSHHILVAFLGVEIIGEVHAVAVVLDVGVADPQGQIVSGQASVRDGVEVVGIVLGHGDGVGVIIDHPQTGQFLGAGALGAVIGVELFEADQRHGRLMILTGSSHSHGAGEHHGEDHVVLHGHGGAVAELQVVVDGHGVGAGAILVHGLLMRLHDGGVELEAAFLGGGDGFQTAGHVLHVQVSSAGVGAAEGGVTELAGQVGGVAQDDAVVRLFGGPVDQGVRGRPVGVGGMLFHALDLRVVQIVVLVGVQRDFGQQGVPALHVQTPPGSVHIVFGIPAVNDLGVVNHGHAQEVEAQLVLHAILFDVAQAGFLILGNIGDGGFSAKLRIQRGVIHAVFFAVDALGLSFLSKGSGNQREQHRSGQNQREQLLHVQCPSFLFASRRTLLRLCTAVILNFTSCPPFCQCSFPISIRFLQKGNSQSAQRDPVSFICHAPAGGSPGGGSAGKATKEAGVRFFSPPAGRSGPVHFSACRTAFSPLRFRRPRPPRLRKNTKKAALSGRFFGCTKLLLGGSSHGAGAGASAAFDALIRIDHVLAVALRDRVHGAFGLAGAAHDAFVRNYICHRRLPPVLMAGFFWEVCLDA